MDKSPHKETIAFFTEMIGLGGVLFIMLGLIVLKFLAAFGLITINFWFL